jgi:ABC-type protease/lipase transport system fused ATPase/permease subunit
METQINRNSAIFATGVHLEPIECIIEGKKQWVELHSGFRRFKNVLENLKIPHKDITANLDTEVDIILTTIFD